MRLTAGWLGPCVPARDLVVSHQQWILIDGPDIARQFGTAEVFTPTFGVLPKPAVQQLRGRMSVEYLHIMLLRHVVLIAEGAAAEIFYLDPMALAALTPEDATRVAIHAGQNCGPISRLATTRRAIEEWANIRRPARNGQQHAAG